MHKLYIVLAYSNQKDLVALYGFSIGLDFDYSKMREY
jgi:hypothetical protein